MSVARLADRVGVLGAVAAALCCAGNAYIIAGLSALGLTAVRKDAILWPVMLGSLAISIWGLRAGWVIHRRLGPLIVGVSGALLVAAGVIVVHGFPAMPMIYFGALVLGLALILNARAHRLACAPRAPAV